ncbi:hypothetical protein PR048_015798 [Dryococelus australis]|uniref:Transposase n=1 Tax=Dryococelus australis TaxID=614101 RepID=A0ABQ9HI61_9NEOP|nr:hypothetical protein PR048_015798 [Dryococelus australis]
MDGTTNDPPQKENDSSPERHDNSQLETCSDITSERCFHPHCRETTRITNLHPPPPKSLKSHDQHTRTNSIATYIALHEKKIKIGPALSHYFVQDVTCTQACARNSRASLLKRAFHRRPDDSDLVCNCVVLVRRHGQMTNVDASFPVNNASFASIGTAAVLDYGGASDSASTRMSYTPPIAKWDDNRLSGQEEECSIWETATFVNCFTASVVKVYPSRAIDVRGERRLRQCVKTNRQSTMEQLTVQMNQGETIHVSTAIVQRTLLRIGLRSRRTHVQRRKRQEFARQYGDWTAADWQRVAFSDESRFQLHRMDGCQRIQRETLENRNPAFIAGRTHGGEGDRVMVWGMISAYSLGPVIRVEGTLDRFSYESILDDHAHPYMMIVFPREDGIFQHDNAPFHPSDLNPIDHLWDHLDRRVRRLSTPPRTLQQLWDALQTAWLQIPAETYQHLTVTASSFHCCPCCEGRMERCLNAMAEETWNPRENPPISAIDRHDSHLQKSGSDTAADYTWFASVGGEQPNRSASGAILVLPQCTEIVRRGSTAGTPPSTVSQTCSIELSSGDLGSQAVRGVSTRPLGDNSGAEGLCILLLVDEGLLQGAVGAEMGAHVLPVSFDNCICTRGLISSHVNCPHTRIPPLKNVRDKVSTFEINLRKVSLSLPIHILTGVLNDMRPVKLVTMDENLYLLNCILLTRGIRRFMFLVTHSYPAIGV